MKSTEIIRALCAQKGISIAKLEKDLNLGNGTIASSKSSYMRSDRLKAIADYFHVSMEYLMTGEDPTAADIPLSPEERSLVIAYREANETTKDNIRKILDIKKASGLSPKEHELYSVDFSDLKKSGSAIPASYDDFITSKDSFVSLVAESSRKYGKSDDNK